MIEYEDIDLLLGKNIRLATNVNLKIPTVSEMVYEKGFSAYVKLFTASTRELFSLAREVDSLERKYPTIWSMLFEEEGNAILGQMFGFDSGTQAMFDSLSYWTGLDVDGFKALGNKKIVHAEGGWIIDEAEFNNLSELIVKITHHRPNTDLIAPNPPNKTRLSDAQWRVWEITYKNRVATAQRNGATIADKILILSVSFDSYLPIKEIMEMQIYYFNRLYDALSEKDSYQTQLAIYTSQKFESKSGLKHWKELIK